MVQGKCLGMTDVKTAFRVMRGLKSGLTISGVVELDNSYRDDLTGDRVILILSRVCGE